MDVLCVGEQIIGLKTSIFTEIIRIESAVAKWFKFTYDN